MLRLHKRFFAQTVFFSGVDCLIECLICISIKTVAADLVTEFETWKRKMATDENADHHYDRLWSDRGK